MCWRLGRPSLLGASVFSGCLRELLEQAGLLTFGKRIDESVHCSTKWRLREEVAKTLAKVLPALPEKTSAASIRVEPDPLQHPVRRSVGPFAQAEATGTYDREHASAASVSGTIHIQPKKSTRLLIGFVSVHPILNQVISKLAFEVECYLVDGPPKPNRRPCCYGHEALDWRLRLIPW